MPDGGTSPENALKQIDVEPSTQTPTEASKGFLRKWGERLTAPFDRLPVPVRAGLIVLGAMTAGAADGGTNFTIVRDVIHGDFRSAAVRGVIAGTGASVSLLSGLSMSGVFHTKA